MSTMAFSTPPPQVPNVLVSSPAPHILVVTLNRPASLNAVTRAMHLGLSRLWEWFDDAEPSLRCAILTGAGRAFCAGADLKEWNASAADDAKQEMDERWARDGFGGLSNRRGKKPVIAAVNGLCLGGGLEMVLNADMVLAAPGAKFGLPEVKRGVVAVAGALPRLMRTVGRQRAAEMALLGRTYDAAALLSWGIVNCIADDGVVEAAVRWASEVAANSPDSVIVSRAGLLGGWDAEDPETSTRRVAEGVYRGLVEGENVREGLTSFVEKRRPRWRDSKL